MFQINEKTTYFKTNFKYLVLKTKLFPLPKKKEKSSFVMSTPLSFLHVLHKYPNIMLFLCLVFML